MDALGLDAVAQLVYVALLTDLTSGVSDLAEQLVRPESDIRGALDHLVELSLLRPSREHAGTLVPVNPAVGLQTLLRRQEHDLAARRDRLQASRLAASRLFAAYADQPGPAAGGDTEHVTGLDAIQARLEQMGAAAQTEVMSLVPGRSIPAETLATAVAGDSDLGERGVTVRVLYQDAVRGDPATMAYGQWMAGRGTQIRTTPLLPQRLLVVDRRAAMVPLDPDNPSACAVYTTNPGLVDQLAWLFEHLWSGATPLAEPRPLESGTGLTSFERSLLELLALGSTDEAAANRLGVSGRTVRRVMADLTSRLEASSRFEAGLKAAKNGWL